MKIPYRTIACAAAAWVVLTAMTVVGAEPVRVRVLSYNIHIGIGMDEKLDLPRIADVIKRTKPDLVGLQEVDRLSQRVKGHDEAAELGKLLNMEFAFSKAREVPGGDYGIAIYSRYPLKDVQRTVFAAEEGCESRTVVSAKVKLGDDGPEILFGNTHLEHANQRVRLRQTDKLLAALEARKPEAAILAGDFNAEPKHEVIKKVAAQWENATAKDPKPTFPAPKPNIKIDYVWYRPAGQWRVVSAEVVDEKVASDHRPLLVVLEWLGKQ